MKRWNSTSTEQVSPSDVIGKIGERHHQYQGGIAATVARALAYSGTRHCIVEDNGDETRQIPDIDDITIHVTKDGTTRPAGEMDLESTRNTPVVECDAISITIRTEDERVIRMQTDIAFARSEEESLTEAGILVTGDATIGHEELTQMICNGFSGYYVDAIQRNGFETEAEYDYRTDAQVHAVHALLDPCEARDKAVEIAICRHVCGYVRDGVDYEVTIRNKKVTVTSSEATQRAA